ncbi:MAG TPA: PHP domain-containing protein [Candidatus Dormibacteraeota bacterium]|nr:PHP domain-containing protein [Candidatus Dormibacteraeota bacterium]
MRVDLHLHSRYSHDSSTTLEALIARARECELDRIALTDHNTVEGALKLAEIAPQLAIVGEEAKTREGEVIGLFITRRIPPYLSPEDAMDMIHAMGGLVYVPHPLDRNRAHYSGERLVALAPRIDIVEVYNPWADAAANRAAADLAAELGKVTATGSDSHGTVEIGRSWMEMEEFDGAADFLSKLARAKHVVKSSSGTGRRA